MKRKTLFLLFLIPFLGISQNKNFILEDGLVYWKYVYENSKDISALRNNPLLTFKTDSTGVIKKTNFNDKKVKKMVGDFKIDRKQGRYRISVFNVRFFVDPITLGMGSMSSQTISEYTIEESLIKKNGTIRKSSLGYNLTETLNPHFVDLFTIKKVKKDEW